ncbi:hypothetical protein B0E45_25900 [Sinorhizobium sp. A49]|nr:hypothetical protein B0E45_25900 [Sinorhizobium sp. A49]
MHQSFDRTIEVFHYIKTEYDADYYRIFEFIFRLIYVLITAEAVNQPAFRMPAATTESTN